MMERLRLAWKRLRGIFNLLLLRPVNEDPAHRATYTGWDSEDPTLG
jgi:heme-degrading monooxygenase HmoA